MPQRTNRSYFRENTKVINADGSVTPGDRFLSTDEPTEETFKRLIESVAYISELDDRAKESEQGLVKTTNGANAKAGVTPNDGATYAAQIANLPRVSTIAQTIDSLQAVLVTAKPKTTDTLRNDYEIGLSTDFIQWLSQQLQTLSDAIDAIDVPDVSGLTQQVDTNTQNIATAQSTADAAVSAAANAQSTADAAVTAAANAQSKADANEQAINNLGNNDGAVIGEYKFMPVAGAPDATYLVCNGQAVSRTTYPDLFAKIGTTFGAGNGSTTFNLPDFSGKGFRGFDATNLADFGTGVSKGNDEVTIADTNLPPHAHGFISGTNSIALSNSAGTNSNTVAKGDTDSGDSLELTPGGTVSNSVSSNNPLPIANPYLTLFVYIKAS